MALASSGRGRKLPARYYELVLPLILSFLMTCAVSLISTWRNVGFIDGRRMQRTPRAAPRRSSTRPLAPAPSATKTPSARRAGRPPHGR